VQFFFVSREDVKSFRPAEDIDPKYAAALREAIAAGVEVMAWITTVKRDSIQLCKELTLSI
jgi:sugar fermentation stimulation protein A